MAQNDMAFPTDPTTRPRAVASRSTLRPWVAAAALALCACGSDAESVDSAPAAAGAKAAAKTATPANAETMGATSTGAVPGVDAQSVSTDGSDGSPAGFERTGDLDLTQFIPNNALAYFECSSLDDLEEAVIRLNNATAITDTIGTAGALATIPLLNVGIDPSRIDRTVPIALAFAPVPGELFPALIVVAPALGDAPVVNSAAALTVRGLKARRVAEGYIVVEPISLGPATSRGEARVTENLPEGLLAGHFDTETFIPLLAPSLYDMAAQLNENYRVSRPKTSANDLYEFSADPIIEALRGPRELAFGIALEADQATLSLRLVDDPSSAVGSTEPSAPAAPLDAVTATLSELSQYIDRDDPLSSLVAFHPETAAANLAALLDKVNAASEARGLLDGITVEGDTFLAMDGAIEKMLGSFHPGVAASMQFEPAKAHLAIYLAAESPERAREAISLLLSKCEYETWGFEMALPIRSMMDRILVEDYSVRFDTRRLDFDQRAKMRSAFKTLLGDSSLHLKVASSDSHVLILLGGDTMAVNSRIRRFSTQGLADRDVVKAIDFVDGARFARINHTDFVKLFGQIAGLGAIAEGKSVADTYREITREVGEGSAPFTCWTAQDGGDSIMGATFPLESLSKAFDAFKGAKL